MTTRGCLQRLSIILNVSWTLFRVTDALRKRILWQVTMQRALCALPKASHRHPQVQVPLTGIC